MDVGYTLRGSARYKRQYVVSLLKIDQESISQSNRCKQSYNGAIWTSVHLGYGVTHIIFCLNGNGLLMVVLYWKWLFYRFGLSCEMMKNT